jgi:hypothetical protein
MSANKECLPPSAFAAACHHRPPTAKLVGMTRDRFAGVWKLIQYARRSSDGQISFPYGEEPVGRITYDLAGRMSALLMRPGRRSTVAPGIGLPAGKASCEEMREALNGFTAYFGTFDVDESAATVIHHVQASLVPSWVVTDLRRTYRFHGDRLTLTATTGGDSVELVWEREEN